MPAAHRLDSLGALLPLQWRGIEVPCANNDTEVHQRLVEHKQWGVAASHVENTGRNSARFSFRLFFRNGISGYDDLYPGRFSQFFSACLDGSTGKLVHPEFGERDAKLDTLRVVWDPNRRDGVDVDAAWLETNENCDTLEQWTMLADAIAAAGELDGDFPDVDIPPYDDGSGMSLTETLKAIQGALLLAQLSVASVMADVANVINAVNDLIDSLSVLTNPRASIAMQYAKDVEAALARLQETLPATKSVRGIANKKIQHAQTVSSAAASYGMSMDDWFALNPMTAASGQLKAGDVVFVYEAA